ncbi:MAG: AI-2E family transporter [Candidatus Binatia bacterium]
MESIEDRPRLSRSRISLWGLVAITALAAWITYRISLPFLAPLAWALALAVVTGPLYRALASILPWPTVASIAAVVIVAILIVAPTIIIARAVAIEIGAHADQLPDAQDAERWTQLATRHPRGAPVLRWLQEQVNVRDQTKAFIGDVVGRLSGVVSGSFWAVAQLFVTMFFLFYFFRDGDEALHTVRSLVPLTNWETNVMFTRVSDTLHATLRGSFLVAGVQGLLGGLIFFLLGLPAPLLWGTAMGFCALLPMLGTFVVWAPACVLLLVDGSYVRALILAGWGAGVVSLIDNLLYPVLVGRDLRLHTVLVFVSLVGGIAMFGFVGLILGPLAFAVTLSLVDIWRARVGLQPTAS